MSELDQIVAIDKGIEIVEKIRRQHHPGSFVWTYCYNVGKRMEASRDALVKTLLSAPKDEAA